MHGHESRGRVPHLHNRRKRIRQHPYDKADPIAEPYTLDVSSLGSEKPIKLDRLEHYLHYHVNLHLSKPYEGQNILEGDLEDVTPSEIKLLVAEKTRKKEISFPRGDVDKARLAIKF